MANLSKIKREKMLDYLENLKDLNNDDENIRAITEIEKSQQMKMNHTTFYLKEITFIL